MPKLYRYSIIKPMINSLKCHNNKTWDGLSPLWAVDLQRNSRLILQVSPSHIVVNSNLVKFSLFKPEHWSNCNEIHLWFHYFANGDEDWSICYHESTGLHVGIACVSTDYGWLRYEIIKEESNELKQNITKAKNHLKTWARVLRRDKAKLKRLHKEMRGLNNVLTA